MGCTSGKPNPEAASNKSSNQPKADVKKHALLVHDNPGKIQEFYNIDKKKLGEGSYGSVSKCTHKTTKAVRAVKLISKTQRKDLQRFKKEIAIMKVMDHPNILKLHETFEDQRFIYLVLELCTGGELFEHIINSGHFTEKQAAIVMKDLFRAIYYMHSSHFAHRDLKPENFLFLAKEDKFENNT
jgi:calcium-dependent protein kinase